MVVHELSTNAVKHGALSQEDGRVAVSWALAPAGDGRGFAMEWRETCPSPPAQSQRRGFGTRVLTSMVQHALDGTVTLELREAGLFWRIETETQKLAET